MIVRVSAGISERCGSCKEKIPADTLVCFLTSAMLKRCATCAGLTKAQQDKQERKWRAESLVRSAMEATPSWKLAVQKAEKELALAEAKVRKTVQRGKK